MRGSGVGTAPVYATPDVSQPARSQQLRSPGGEAGGQGPDARVRGTGDFGGVVPQSSLSLHAGTRGQAGRGRGGVGRAGHPLPLGALTPRGWTAGAAQPPGRPWGQRVTLGPDPARWPWQGQEWGQRQGDAIPRGRSILRHPRAGLAPHFGLLPAPAPSSHGCGPCSSLPRQEAPAGCRGLWTHPVSPAQGQRKGLFLFAGTVGSGTHLLPRPSSDKTWPCLGAATSCPLCRRGDSPVADIGLCSGHSPLWAGEFCATAGCFCSKRFVSP